MICSEFIATRAVNRTVSLALTTGRGQRTLIGGSVPPFAA